MKTLLSNAKVFTHGSFLETNVLIEDGVVFSLSDSIDVLAADPSVSVIDYSGVHSSVWPDDMKKQALDAGIQIL